MLLLLLLLKSVEFDDGVALVPSVAGLVMGPHNNSASSANQTQEKINVGEGAYSSTHILCCKHQNPVAWKNSKTTGEGCSFRGLPELLK